MAEASKKEAVGVHSCYRLDGVRVLCVQFNKPIKLSCGVPTDL